MRQRSAYLLLVLALCCSTAQARPLGLKQRFGQLAQSCKRVVDRIRGKQEKITSVRIDFRAVGDWSTASLLMSSANQVVRLGPAASRLAPPLAGFGSVGLGIYSLRDFVKAETAERRVDAAHGIAWSLQGMAGLGQALRGKGSWIAPTARTLGVAGGVMQMGIGGYRVASALRQAPGKGSRRSRAILGTIDLCAGACWAASSCGIAAPYTLGGFIVLTAGRMAYTHRDALSRAAGRLVKRFKRRGPEAQVIVTAPASPEVAERALQGSGTAEIRDQHGRKAVLTPATVRTESGKQQPAFVVTPVDGPPTPAPGR